MSTVFASRHPISLHLAVFICQYCYHISLAPLLGLNFPQEWFHLCFPAQDTSNHSAAIKRTAILNYLMNNRKNEIILRLQKNQSIEGFRNEVIVIAEKHP